MSKQTIKVVVVGGGTAGWITAGTIAAGYLADADSSRVQVTLVESPDIPIIGVGEGTWPSMRTTLQSMGISETEFVRKCDVSFKQGSKFVGWKTEDKQNYYYHPFSLPVEHQSANTAEYWLEHSDKVGFADAVSPQIAVCEKLLAPKQESTPEYAFNLNYGYHLDAGKFANLLAEHCVKKLGVELIRKNMHSVKTDDAGYIESITLDDSALVEGDLFVDCTGQRSLLIGEHFKVPNVDLSAVSFNDRALAVQVPRSDPKEPISSVTTGTAQSEGWIWDIGLQSRRGVGYVFSSNHSSVDQAHQVLETYVLASSNSSLDDLTVRELKFSPSHLEKFWVKNCVAVGLSAGFIEPLEATALVLIEQSANMIKDMLPRNRMSMEAVANRYNEKLRYHWKQILNFLKLHYVLTERSDTQYWMDQKSAESIPQELKESLLIWSQQCPWHTDAPRIDELFPYQSWQYVLYGMGYAKKTELMRSASNDAVKRQVEQLINDNIRNTQKFVASLSSNRQLLDHINQVGLRAG